METRDLVANRIKIAAPTFSHSVSVGVAHVERWMVQYYLLQYVQYILTRVNVLVDCRDVRERSPQKPGIG